MPARFAVVATIVALVAGRSPALAETAGRDATSRQPDAPVTTIRAVPPAAGDDTTPKETPLYAGSTVTYRNSVTTLTFDESAELTHNPTWVMSWELAPRLRLSEIFSVSARLDFSRELTDSDTNTFADETLLSNTSLSARASRWLRVPGAGIEVSNSVGLIVPTSKGARAQTLYLGLRGTLGLSRRFDVLSGLTLDYTLGLTKFFNEHTTSERETPLVPGCFASSGGCESHLGTGVRNVSWSVTNTFDVGLSFTEWIRVGATFGVLTSFLYGGAEDARVSLTPQDTTDTRHVLLYDLRIEVVPVAPLTIVAGTNTLNPQLAPDSSRYRPFFNRYTTLYLDLRLDVAEFVTALTHL